MTLGMKIGTVWIIIGILMLFFELPSFDVEKMMGGMIMLFIGATFFISSAIKNNKL